MRRFSLGVVVGLMLGWIGTVVAAELSGNDGFLPGWTVTLKGKPVCYTPFVLSAPQLIMCP